MLIVMKPSAAPQEVDAVVNVIQEIGLRPHPMPGATRTAIGVTGNTGPVDSRRFENLAGVAEVIRVTKPDKLITLDLRRKRQSSELGMLPSEEVNSLLSRDHAQSRATIRHSPWLKQCSKAVRASFGAASGSPKVLPMRFKDWERKAGKSCPRFVRRLA